MGLLSPVLALFLAVSYVVASTVSTLRFGARALHAVSEGISCVVGIPVFVSKKWAFPQHIQYFCPLTFASPSGSLNTTGSEMAGAQYRLLTGLQYLPTA